MDTAALVKQLDDLSLWMVGSGFLVAVGVAIEVMQDVQEVLERPKRKWLAIFAGVLVAIGVTGEALITSWQLGVTSKLTKAADDEKEKFQKELSEAKERTATATLRAEQLQKESERQRAYVVRAAARLRTLNRHVPEDFATNDESPYFAHTEGQRLNVFVPPGDQEARSFANEVAAGLRGVHWSVAVVAHDDPTDMRRPGVVLVETSADADEPARKAADGLTRALSDPVWGLEVNGASAHPVGAGPVSGDAVLSDAKLALVINSLKSAVAP